MGGLLGFAVGLTGVGGAALTIPALVFILGLSTVTAIATSFPFVAVIKLFGFIQHRHQGTFHLPISLALLSGSVPGTVAGVLVISRLSVQFGAAMDIWLNFSIGALIIVSMSAMFITSASRAEPTQNEGIGRNRWLAGVFLGFLAGLVIGATSVGGGILIIFAIHITYRIPAAGIVGTSIGVSLILMVVGSIGYSGSGLVDFQAVLYLSLGGVPGIILGSKLVNRVPQVALLRLVALAGATAGVSLIGKGIQLSL